MNMKVHEIAGVKISVYIPLHEYVPDFGPGCQVCGVDEELHPDGEPEETVLARKVRELQFLVADANKERDLWQQKFHAEEARVKALEERIKNRA